MERNYDEIIADILIQLDVHTQELTKQSQKSDLLQIEHDRFQSELTERFVAMEKIDSNLLEQLVHSASILDRIIKKNDLQL